MYAPALSLTANTCARAGRDSVPVPSAPAYDYSSTSSPTSDYRAKALAATSASRREALTPAPITPAVPASSHACERCERSGRQALPETGRQALKWPCSSTPSHITKSPLQENYS